MTQASASVSVQIDGAVATLTLNNPERRNALNMAMWEALKSELVALDSNDKVRALVVRGAGDKAFSAGADIKEFAELLEDRERLDRNNVLVQEAQIALEEFSKPAIAMIRGACMGGGCGIALACDFRIAERDAKMGITPAKLGLLYSVRDTERLHRLVGSSITRQMLFTGQPL